MGFIVFLGTIIMTVIAITSAVMGVAAIVAVATSIEDNAQKFYVIYSMLGWLVIGMWIASFLS